MNTQVRVYKSALDGKYYKYSGNPDRTHEFYNAGIVTPTDVADVEAVVILDEVMGRARPNYNLRSLCRVIPMDQLVCTIDLATGFTVQRKVPPLVEAEISKDAYSTITFNLWKNVGHVVVSDEAGMKARHPILGESIDECARDLPRAENLDIKDASDTITEKVSSAAYSDWGAKTSAVSNTDPHRLHPGQRQTRRLSRNAPDFVGQIHPQHVCPRPRARRHRKHRRNRRKLQLARLPNRANRNRLRPHRNPRRNPRTHPRQQQRLSSGARTHNGSAVPRRKSRLRRLHHTPMAPTQSHNPRRPEQNLHLNTNTPLFWGLMTSLLKCQN